MNKRERARQIRKRLKFRIEELSNSEALAVSSLFDEFTAGVSYLLGDRVLYKDILYEVIQEHTSQANWTPDVTPSLFKVIDIEHSGMFDDPIPYAVGMEVFNGKYYTENGVKYLCIRDSGQALYNNAKDLVNIYFSIIE